MESCVYFKFKSQKEPTRVEFDGTGISVFELKREIILKSGLGAGTDFDLAIYTEDGNEEYDDDTTIITRSTTVIARRLPPMKPGAGRAARYVNGKMPIHAKNQSRREQASKASAKSTSNALEQINKAMTESEKLAAVFKAQSDVWNNNEDELAKNATTQQRPGHGKKPANVPDHEPPNGYICYRCGEKGHWIQLCPTNDNPEYDNRPRVKRTTGIPRSFLKTVDKSTALGHNGTDEDSKPPVGLMVNADGEFVVAAPDTASWQQFQAKTKNAASKQSGQDGDKDLQERGLLCELDKKMFLDPMKTPCCAKTYCNECISNALMESDFVCPGCQKEGVLLDDLENDSETSAKIQQYLDEKSKQAHDEKEESNSPQAKSPSAEPQEKKQSEQARNGQSKPRKSASPSITSVKLSGQTQDLNGQRKKSPNPPSDSGQSRMSETSKKRPADEVLENAPKIPKGPKAMQNKSAQNQQQQNAVINPMMNGMNGMVPMMGMGMNGINRYMMPMNMPMYMNGGSFANFPMNGGSNMYPNMNGNINDMGAAAPMGAIGAIGAAGGPNMNGNFMGNGMNGGGVSYQNNYNNGGYQGNRQWRQFNNQRQQSEEDDAYMRKPVNPHRHQNRMRRARPSDYREL